MTITRRNIRRLLFDQVPGLGFSGTADSVATTSLTDTAVFADSTVAVGHYRGHYLVRPDRTGDDRIKRITTINTTTGAASHNSTVYSNTTDTNYEVIGLIHPDELDACITRAMKRIYYEVQVPLVGIVTDGDMEGTTTASWTASSGNITLTKSTTADKVFSGTRSLRGVQVATAQYASSQSFRVYENTVFYASALVHAPTGTAQFDIYDLSNTTVVASITSNDPGWSHVWLQGQVPSGCELMQVRLGGVENNADIYWDHALFYNRDEYRLPAPSWLDEQHKFLKLREARYRRTVNSTSSGGVDMGNSLTFDDWYQPNMYSLEPFHVDANPYVVQLQQRCPMNELWINGKRAYVDTEPLTADTDTTHAPENLVVAYARQELVTVLRRRYPSDKRWEFASMEAAADVDAQTASRPETPLQPVRREEWLGYV